MVARWVAGAENLVDERIAYADANGLSPRVGAEYRVSLSVAGWRFVFHTMEAPEDDPDTVPDEGWELPQTRSYIIRHRAPPHLWALPLHDYVAQTVPLDLASYALLHDWAGYPETNHVHAIQVEVIGWARDGLDDPALCEWLGRRVLKPVLDAGVPIDLANLAPSDGSAAYGVNGTVRFSAEQWYRFDGICGHQNVPRNSHWDPGVARYDLIARAARAQPPVPPVDLPEVPMGLPIYNFTCPEWKGRVRTVHGDSVLGWKSNADRLAWQKIVQTQLAQATGRIVGIETLMLSSKAAADEHTMAHARGHAELAALVKLEQEQTADLEAIRTELVEPPEVPDPAPPGS